MTDAERLEKVTKWARNLRAYANGDMFPMTPWPLATFTSADLVLVEQIYGQPIQFTIKLPPAGLLQTVQAVNNPPNAPSTDETPTQYYTRVLANARSKP